MKPRLMNSVFADSLKRGKDVRASDVSDGRAYLLRIAESRPTKGFIAPTEKDDDLLLEQVASLCRIWRRPS